MAAKPSNSPNRRPRAQGFEWSPDGAQIAYTAADKRGEERKKHLGDFEVVRRDYAHSHLWTITVSEAMRTPAAGTQRTKGMGYSLGGFAWSPDGKRIAFSATQNPDLVQGGTSDLYVLTLEGDAVKKIVDQPGPDRGAVWSPDGKWIAFSSAMGNPKFFHANARIAVVGADGGPVRPISDAFDEQPSIVDWNADGVYFTGLMKTRIQATRVDPANGRLTLISAGPVGSDFSLTKDGRMAALTIGTAEHLAEVHVTEVAKWASRKLTGIDRASEGLDASGQRSDLVDQSRRRPDRRRADASSQLRCR
jgi:Tol biopolymer transport system component